MKLQSPWIITQQGFEAFRQDSKKLEENAKESNTYLETYYQPRKMMEIDGNGVAHIYITNSLLDNAPMIYEMAGIATTYETLSRELSEAYTNAKAVFLHLDSGGGMVTGCIEIANLIANSPIPIVAHVTGMACSACYKLASGADAIYANQSAEIGSVGVILSMMTVNWEMVDLYNLEVFTSDGADLKGIGLDKLTESQREFLQAQIDDCAEVFHNHVMTHRDELDDEVFRAGHYRAEIAQEMGLIDGVMSEGEAYQTLTAQI